jgi:hypothetical protein
MVGNLITVTFYSLTYETIGIIYYGISVYLGSPSILNQNFLSTRLPSLAIGFLSLLARLMTSIKLFYLNSLTMSNISRNYLPNKK